MAKQLEIERYHGQIIKVGECAVHVLYLPDWGLEFIVFTPGQMEDHRSALQQMRAKIVKVTNKRIYFTQ